MARNSLDTLVCFYVFVSRFCHSLLTELSVFNSNAHVQQSQLYFAGHSRYIGVFNTQKEANLAYETARDVLKGGKPIAATNGAASELRKAEIDKKVNDARRMALEAVMATKREDSNHA